jgi:MFS family permease
MAVNTIIQYAGNASAQQSLRFAPASGFHLFSVAACCFLAAVVPLALTRTVPPDRPTQPKLQLRWLLSVSPVAVAACFVSGFGNGSFWTLAPSFGTTIGLTAVGVGTMMTAAIVGSAIGQWPAGKISDRVDRRYVMAGAGAIAAVMCFAIATLGQIFPASLTALVFGFGLVGFALYPAATSHANDMGGRENSVSISSGLLLVYCIGAVIGPTVAAYLMERIGPSGLFFMIGAGDAALAIFALYRRRARPVAPSEPAPPAPIPLEETAERPPATLQ